LKTGRIQENGEKLLLDIINIEEKVYLKYPVLKLIYNKNNQINIIFSDSDDLLDIIYVESNKYDSYDVFDYETKKEIKEFIDSI